MYTLKVSNSTPHLYGGVLVFLFKLCHLHTNVTELIAIHKKNHFLDIHENSNDDILLPVLQNEQKYECSYKDVQITVHEVQSETTFVMYQSHTASPVKTLFLEFDTDDTSFTNTILTDIHSFIKNDFKQIESMHVIHYIFTDYFEWEKSDTYNKRKLSTLYLPQDTKDQLIEDVDNFYNNKQVALFYENMGIAQTRIYLFYGYPGTGKTTTAYVLASKLNLNICTLDFTNKVDDFVFRRCIKSIPHNSVLLIEDIDHLFSPQKDKDEFRHSITFSGLLNILDGISKVRKLICIITCNNIAVLDKTLLRRIDYSVEFNSGVTEYQLDTFCDELPFEVNKAMFIKFFKSKETTINIIQKWILHHVHKLIAKEYEITDKLSEFNEYNKWYQKNFKRMDLYN